MYASEAEVALRRAPQAPAVVPQTPKKGGNVVKSASPIPSTVMNLLVSLPGDELITALFAKVESDYSQKQPGNFISCHQVLIQDCCEIVDVSQSQVQAYLTDMMHVTILATVAESTQAKPVISQ